MSQQPAITCPFSPKVQQYAEAQHNRELPATVYLSAYLPVINRKWANDTKRELWLGWFSNHLYMRTYSAHMSKGHYHALHKMQETKSQLEDLLTQKPPEAISYAMWELLLTKVIPAMLKKSRNLPDIIHTVVTASATLRLRKERNERVTSQEWNDLNETIAEAFELITEQSDRKDSTTQHQYNRFLTYCVGAARSAAQKNTDTSLANTLRDTLNALENFHEPKVKARRHGKSTRKKPPEKKRSKKPPPLPPKPYIISADFLTGLIVKRLVKL